MKNIIFRNLIFLLIISGCNAPLQESAPILELTDTPAQNTKEIGEDDSLSETQAYAPYLNANLPIDMRVDDLLSRMTLDEKIGQMTQVEKGSITPAEVKLFAIGSVLSGGGGSPSENTAESWAKMVDSYQEAALETRLRIPIIYGVDAVHGHANLKGATFFPHNIGLGAAADPELMFRIGQATAIEMWATGIPWNFSPVVAVPQDIRWGRTYEGFSESTELVSQLAIPYIEGLQSSPKSRNPSGEISTLGTAKHFIGDGATVWGASSAVGMGVSYKLDQGDMQLDESQIRQLLLPTYQAALDAGVLSVMVSFNSWKGEKLHGSDYWLNGVLKNELGFEGFVVSDWQGIDQISGNYYNSVVTALNSGIDMNMVPYAYLKYLETLKTAVENEDISIERIDDAVRRILTVKFKLGLFEQPFSQPELLSDVGSDSHRTIAREAVRKSLVLLKNEGNTIPLSKDTPIIFVSGKGARDIGLQSGGWSIEWQGMPGNISPGTTILEGIREAVNNPDKVVFDRKGLFVQQIDGNDNPQIADVGIVVVAEIPYAEGVGDKEDLRLPDSDAELIQAMRQRCDKLLVIILSGRPLVITEQFQIADAWIAAWLPGTQGEGVADVIFGDYPFTGKLPYTWPRNNQQLPININNIGEQTGCEGPLFPFGYGLGEAGSEPIKWIECP
jgi:beta-glucosidase